MTGPIESSLRADSAQVSLQSYPGWDGFLGTRGSWMLDFICLMMIAFVPILLWSIYLVRYRRQFARHKRIQLILGAALLIAIICFEIEMQFITPWEVRAEPSPYFDTNHKWQCLTGRCLLIHLTFAIPTTLLWLIVILQALRNFPSPPQPGAHSRKHIVWGRIAAPGMCLTAFTGWIFYWLAFVAT